MFALLARLVPSGSLLVFGGVVVGVLATQLLAYSVGVRSERASCIAQQQRAHEADLRALQNQLRQADAATAAAQRDARDARAYITTLTQEIRHAPVPLVVQQPVRCAVPRPPAAADAGRQPGQPAVAGAAALAPAAAAAGAAPAPPAAGGGGGHDLRVTLGFVRLWNSALAGRSVDAGACGAADPAAPACAAAAEGQPQ